MVWEITLLLNSLKCVITLNLNCAQLMCLHLTEHVHDNDWSTFFEESDWNSNFYSYSFNSLGPQIGQGELTKLIANLFLCKFIISTRTYDLF